MKRTNTLKKIRPILFAVTVVFAFLFAFGLWTLPSPKDKNSDGFSAERVIEDLKIISKDHHSIVHPEARAEVRNYLIGRLQSLGADSVRTLVYPNIDYKKGDLEFHFDATDVLAEFTPVNASDSTTYLMLVAHYDSRYPWAPIKDTICSYGAADDGYGVGVILETVRNAVKNRKSWNQGIKVLFTDAEEVHMNGMYEAFEKNHEIFENVGMLINIESRGPYGPCVLFETSTGNDKVISFYKKNAKYPFTYSLTNVVYSFMPNFTDFTVVKDHLPGMNFSALGDINHYHTDLDNITAVNAKTLQHYGAQILPVVDAYLTNPEYADKDYFRGTENTANFTIPVLGFFNFSQKTYLWLNIGIVVLFIILLMFQKPVLVEMLKKAAGILGLSFLSLAFGLLVAWVSSVVVGAKFRPFGIITGIPFDNIAMICATVVVALCLIFVFFKSRDKQSWLFGTMLVQLVLSLVMLFTIKENMLFMLPFSLATIFMLLFSVTKCRFMVLLGVFAILLHALSFLYVLALALTIGAIGVVLLIATFDMMLVISMSKTYLCCDSCR